MALTRLLTRGVKNAPYSFWTGSSAGDISPATLGPDLGDRAYRSDTGLEYVYTGAGVWTATDVASAGGAPVRTIVAPQDNPEVNNSVSYGAANQFLGCRIIIPKTGNLRDLYIYNKAASGNLRAAVYDIGATTSAVRTRVWDGSSVACSAFSWVSLGDPNLAVTAGQHLDFACGNDTGSAEIGRRTLQDTEAGKLSTSLNVGGCQWKVSWAKTEAGFASPSTVAEAGAAGSTTVPIIVARIS